MKTKNVLSFASLFLFTVLTTSLTWAQGNTANRPSPHTSASGKVAGANIMIDYGSPSVKGREVWGKLVPYGQVWRSGADEATTFETDKDIKVEGKTLPAGKYGFFTVPGADEWTIVFNKVPNQWGAFKYDQGQDALRVTAKPHKLSKATERLVYDVTNKGIVLRWENTEVPVSIN